jgi:hypothetical protein
MTSAIVSSTIDADFPVSGQDNDSQGFRDNFNVIKDGLATAASEITILQTDTAKLNEGNDFNGVLISNALTNQVYGKTFSTTTVGNTAVDLENGDYQKFTITGTHTLTFTNWPDFDDSRHAKVRVELRSNGTNYNVTFATTTGGILQFLGGLTNPVATGTDITEPRIFDVWSSDNGTNVYVSRIGGGLDNTVLNDIIDVVLTSPTPQQSLVFNGTNWINSTLAIDNLSDVDTSTTLPSDGQVLTWDQAGTKWKPVSLSSDVNTTYAISAETATGGVNVRLTGSDTVTDDVKIAEGTGITVTRTDDSTITIATTVVDTNTTYGISAETTTGGTNLRLTNSASGTDDVKIADGNSITVTRTDDSTITIDYVHNAQSATSNVNATANQYISVDTSSGAVTITLPATTTAGDFVVIADNGNATTNNITIDPNGNNINGFAGNKTVSVDYTIVTLVSDGTDWIGNTGSVL